MPGPDVVLLKLSCERRESALIARFAAAERSRDAAVLSLLRGVILVVPCAVVLANIFGLTGLWLAVPTAEVLSLLCGLYLLYREKKSEKTALQAV